MEVCARCGAELPAGARFCASCGAPVESEPGGGERKLATVLFADLVGSTALGGSQDPERTRMLMDRFYDAMAEEVERAGGTVEKFAGDAVMAAFGAPVALEDHAERCLHAALAMRERVRALDPRLELRVGVNTGEVVVGRAREGSSFVTGDPVNVAARLEQGAEPGEILVGERTVTAARGAFEFDEERTIEAKGKPGGVRCRRLLRALSLMRARGVGGLHSAFVGRDGELERLLAALQSAVDEARPRLVTVVGDAGVGKTRLVRELWEQLGRRSPEPLRRTGRCLPYGQAITYWPLAEVLKEHFGLLDSDGPESVLEKLGDRRLLALALGLDVAGGEHPLLVRDRFQDAWTDFLSSLIAERPAVLLVEDLHWGEEQLLDLLERLVEDVRGPLLVLATARHELLDRRPGWSSRGRAELVELEALSAADAESLLEALLASRLPQELRAVVVERAEGNPFFVEELLATLIDRGVLRRDNGGWSCGELPDDFRVPDSVQAVLAARIDLLEPAEKEALQAAAVIGRVFWPAPVYELVGGEPDLRVLEERDFVRRRSGSSMAGEREYAIKHTLTREVAYAGLPKARRARLHAAFAAWLERLGEGRDDLAAQLAHHYAAAVRPEDADLAWAGEEAEAERLRAQAVRWLRRAAELAVARYELQDARQLLEQALELEGQDDAKAELWREIGRIHALGYEGEPFWQAMERSLALGSDPAILAETYAELAAQTAARGGMWPRRPPRELVEGWIGKALELATPGTAPEATALLARAMWDLTAGIEPARRAAEIADELGDPALRAEAYMACALSSFAAVDYGEAAEWAERTRELDGELHDPDLRVEVYFTSVFPAAGRGDFATARRFARVHDERNAPLSAHHRLHGIAVLLEIEELAGSWERVLELEERAVETANANHATPCIRNARALYICALARAYGGEAERSRELEELADEVALEGYGLTVDGPRIRLALARGDLGAVGRLLTLGRSYQQVFHLASHAALLDGLAALGDPHTEAEALPLLKPDTYLEPFALRALGLVRQDEQLVERALARFEGWGLDWYARQTRELVAQA
jgi:class 3 adenylate cyclase